MALVPPQRYDAQHSGLHVGALYIAPFPCRIEEALGHNEGADWLSTDMSKRRSRPIRGQGKDRKGGSLAAPASPILILGIISGGDFFASHIGVIWLANHRGHRRVYAAVWHRAACLHRWIVPSVDHTVELQDLSFEHSQLPNLLRQRCENQFPACAKNCEHPGNPVIQRKQELPRRTSRLPSNCGNRATP
jgi:hypothetical protein